MKLNRRTKVAVILSAALLSFALVKILLPRDPDIVCHKYLQGSLTDWMIESHTDAYPNVGGNSVDSLIAMKPYFGPDVGTALHDYVYLPGLRPDDPTNLVLFYVKEKSRRRWHGERFLTVFHEKKWVVISPGFQADEIECNAWIDTPEFRKRLSQTIDFLKKEQRLNWQTTVTEQEKFLESIKNQDQ